MSMASESTIAASPVGDVTASPVAGSSPSPPPPPQEEDGVDGSESVSEKAGSWAKPSSTDEENYASSTAHESANESIATNSVEMTPGV